MLKTFAATGAAAALFAAGPAIAQDAAVVGTWDTTAETPMGNFEAQMIVAEGEDGYTVEMIEAPMPGPGGGEAPEMESTISDVSVDGNALTFERSLTTPQGPMELSYSFTADGDEISGEANSQFGAIPITGSRSQ